MSVLARHEQMPLTTLNGDSIAPDNRPHPLAILDRAVATNAPVEVIRECSAIAMTWKKEEARDAFNRAMAKAQTEMPPLVHDKKNTHTNSGYVSFAKVLRETRPILTRNGLTISFSEADCAKPDWIKVMATVRHIDGHAEMYYRTGPIDTLGPKGNPVKTGLHGSSSSATYLNRHLYCGIFAIAIAGEDQDGNAMDAFITNDQVKELKELLTESGHKTDEQIQSFLDWAGVATLAEMSRHQYVAAVPMLNALIDKQRKAAAKK